MGWERCNYPLILVAWKGLEESLNIPSSFRGLMSSTTRWSSWRCRAMSIANCQPWMVNPSISEQRLKTAPPWQMTNPVFCLRYTKTTPLDLQLFKNIDWVWTAASCESILSSLINYILSTSWMFNMTNNFRVIIKLFLRNIVSLFCRGLS